VHRKGAPRVRLGNPDLIESSDPSDLRTRALLQSGCESWSTMVTDWAFTLPRWRFA
jgi:hypothetical protein